MATDAYVAHDYDGNYYLVGQQGEIEEDLSYRYVYVTQTDARVFTLGTASDLTTVPVQAAVQRTLRLNYWHLMSLDGDKVLTPEIARRCAWFRTMGLLKGWGDTGQNQAARNCLYNDVHVVPDGTTFQITADQLRAGPLSQAERTTGGTVARGVAVEIPLYDGANDAGWRAVTKVKLLNIVCLIAFFMRTRGHHFIEDMLARYQAIWRKCLYEEDNPGVEWAHIAHTCFHFIYPDVLDNIWTTAVQGALCAGALVKRIDSACAGVAAVGAVSSGAADIAIVFPAIRGLVPDAFEELKRCEDAIERHRWTGSINRRFYGGPDLTPNEKKLGALAAVILAAYEGVANNAPLKDSKALKRVAANAAITGALIAQMIQKAITDDRMIDPLFLEVEDSA